MLFYIICQKDSDAVRICRLNNPDDFTCGEVIDTEFAIGYDVYVGY